MTGRLKGARMAQRHKRHGVALVLLGDRSLGKQHRPEERATHATPRRLRPMLALALAVFSGGASMRCLDTLLPALAANFGDSIGSVGVAVSAYALSYSVFQLLYGSLADRAGAYRVVAWVTCLSAVAAALCALATSLFALIALRFLAGALAAGVGPLTLAWLSRSTAAEDRPLVFARMATAVIVGTAAGQVGGGIVGGMFGWRYVFVALALLFATSGFSLTLAAARDPAILDRVGRVNARGRISTLSVARRPAVLRVLAAVAVQGFALFLSLTYVGALLRERFGLGLVQAGLVLSGYGLGGIAFVICAQRIIGAVQPGRRAAAGGSILFLGFVGLSLAGSTALAGLSLFAVGFGFLMLHNVLQIMASDMATDRLGTSLSLFAAVSCLAQAIGAAVGGKVFDQAGPAILLVISGTLLASLGWVTALQGRRA